MRWGKIPPKPHLKNRLPPRAGLQTPAPQRPGSKLCVLKTTEAAHCHLIMLQQVAKRLSQGFKRSVPLPAVSTEQFVLHALVAAHFFHGELCFLKLLYKPVHFCDGST